MGKYVLALDQGTTSCRSILFDTHGQPVSSAQHEFSQSFPKPGWVEHDAEEIWKTQLRTIQEALIDAACGIEEVETIGITNQRETIVLWDRATGKPVAPAIVWQDRRTADVCAQWGRDGAEELLKSRTGLRLDPYFSASKLHYLLRTIPNCRAAADRGDLAFGTIDTWLIWNLTGGRSHVTDATNASRTLLYSLEDGVWDPELLSFFDIPAAVLPEIRGSCSYFGETEASLLGKAIPITGVAGDQHAALFGQGCHKVGMAKNTYGTGCFLLMNIGPKPIASKNGLLTTVAWQIGEKRTFALEGSAFIAGAAIQWLRDQLGIISSASEIEGLANQVEDSGGVSFVPAFAGLGAPYWDPDARGLICGLTRGSSRAHIARAALESIALQSYDLLDAMRTDSGRQITELRVDGGASVNRTLMQLQADLCQAPVDRAALPETTALGAALLAGLGAGIWSSLEEVAALRQSVEVLQPSAQAQSQDELIFQWHQAIEKTRG